MVLLLEDLYKYTKVKHYSCNSNHAKFRKNKKIHGRNPNNKMTELEDKINRSIPVMTQEVNTSQEWSKVQHYATTLQKRLHHNNVKINKKKKKKCKHFSNT